MSSTEDRDARQERQHKANRSRKRRAGQPQSAGEIFGPSRYQRERDRWSDDYTGTDPHDEEWFQDHELDFNNE